MKTENEIKLSEFIVKSEYDWLPKLTININEPLIKFGEVIDDSDQSRNMSDREYKIWLKRKPSDDIFADIMIREEGKNIYFNSILEKRDRVCSTICASDAFFAYDYPRRLNSTERILYSSFPLDYDANKKDIPFLTGMSVAPIQMAHIADAIYNQWLKPIKRKSAEAKR